MTETLRIGRRDVRVTHPDKLLFPRARITKLDLARHYERVAPVMLPVRGGTAAGAPGVPGRRSTSKGFFMKAVPSYFPDWVAPRDGAQARRHGHPRAGRRRGHARLPGRPERGHAARLALARGRAAQARPPDPRLRPLRRRLRRRARGRARRRRAPARRRASCPTRWSRARAACTWCARCAAGRASATCTSSRAAMAEEMVARRPAPPDARMAQGRPRLARSTWT